MAELEKCPRCGAPCEKYGASDHKYRYIGAETVRDCPHCQGKGWYVVPNRITGEPEQEQCLFCLGRGKLYTLEPPKEF